MDNLYEDTQIMVQIRPNTDKIWKGVIEQRVTDSSIVNVNNKKI